MNHRRLIRPDLRFAPLPINPIIGSLHCDGFSAPLMPCTQVPSSSVPDVWIFWTSSDDSTHATFVICPCSALHVLPKDWKQPRRRPRLTCALSSLSCKLSTSHSILPGDVQHEGDLWKQFCSGLGLTRNDDDDDDFCTYSAVSLSQDADKQPSYLYETQHAS